MDFFSSVFLGIVQGVAEFLPISSSGHLVLFQNLIGIKEPALFFDVCLHFGTLLAIIVFYFDRIKELIASLFDVKGIKSGENKNFVFAMMIIISCFPTALIGLVIKHYSEFIFANVILTGSMLIITSIILFSLKFLKANKSELSTTQYYIRAFIIGVIQGCAVLPGISRSGSTIAAGLFSGLKREEAASFSFLMSLPAVFGAALLELKDVSFQYISSNYLSVLAGTFAAFIVGYVSLVFLIKLVNKGKLYYFAPYCALAGILGILLGF